MSFRAFTFGMVAIVVGWTVPAFGEDPVPLTVSPGAVGGFTGVEARCPTFSWQTIPEAASTELVVYQLPPDTDLAWWSLDAATEVLFMTLPAGVNAWTPPLELGLTRGAQHVWYVRGLLEHENATDWSTPRFFSIAAATEPEPGPSTFGPREPGSTAGADQSAREAIRKSTEAAPGARRQPAAVGAKAGTKNATTAAAAIRAEMSGPTGEEYGVVGIANTPDGAGLAAVNLVDGPDLVLDGSSNSGQADTMLSQSGLDRPSPNTEGFVFENSGAGTLDVEVIGRIIADGSGLSSVDAETLDGIDGADFATEAEAAALVATHVASADHDDRYYTETELDTSGGGGSVHWDNLASVPAGFADGVDNTGSPTTYQAGLGIRLQSTRFSVDSLQGYNRVVVSNGLTSASGTAIVMDTRGPAIFATKPDALLRITCEDTACTASVPSNVTAGVVDGRIDAIQRPGGGHVVAFQQTAGPLRLLLLCDEGKGCTEFGRDLDTGDSPSIAVGSDGLIGVSYNSGGNVEFARCGDASCIGLETVRVPEVASAVWNDALVRALDGQTMVLASTDTSGWHQATCGGPFGSLDCTSETDYSGVGSTFELVRGADGNLAIATADGLSHCGAFSCPPVTGLSGVAVAIGWDGLAKRVFVDATDGSLRLAQCHDITCTGETEILVDPGPASAPSIAIGPDGLPLLAHVDTSTGELIVTHCGNRHCIPYAMD
jgi:hypothetical protein